MATYSNPFQTMYNPYQYPQLNTVSQSQPPMVWVKGQQQAEIYPQASNSTVILWDSEEDVIYIKSTDVLGKPSMKILDYKVRETSKWEKKDESQESEKYATKQDLIDLMNKFTEQIQQLKPTVSRKLDKED